MIVFCHLLNDRSGSPMVLRDTLRAVAGPEDRLYVGSDGRTRTEPGQGGVLDEADIETRRYWYRRSRYRIVTLFTYIASQIALYRALSRARDIPRDAVVFVNTLLPFGAALWGRRTGRAVVVHVHEASISPAPLRAFLTACAARCATRLIYVSRDHRDRLPIAGPPSEILHNAVNPDLAARATMAYVPRRSGRFEVLMLASPRGFKGIAEFMALASGLSDRGDIAFTLVLNATFEEVAAFGARYPGADNVTVHARTDDPARFYATADLVVNLTRPDLCAETFGLTLAEAMVFGIPVIAPPVGGPAEIVTHGQEGSCIDSRDAEALRRAVLALANDPERAMAMSRAGRVRAGDFTFAAYAGRIRALLDQVRAGGETGQGAASGTGHGTGSDTRRKTAQEALSGTDAPREGGRP